MTRLARRIQRQLEEGGFTDREEILEAVREEMTRVHGLDITTIEVATKLRANQQDNSNEQAVERLVNAYREHGVTTFGEMYRHIQERVGMQSAPKLKKEFRQAWNKTSPEIKLFGSVDTVDPSLTKLARQIQRDLVDGGLTKRLEVLEAVREELSQILGEDFSEIQVMDAFSGYGQSSLPSQESTASIEKCIRT